MHTKQSSNHPGSNNPSNGTPAYILSAAKEGHILKRRILTLRYKQIILHRRMEYLIQSPDQHDIWVLAPGPHYISSSLKYEI